MKSLASRLIFLAACAAAAFATASPILAQSLSSGTIHGIVKDETGGALPGVTVTLASEALQLRQVTNVTGADGAYRFVDLPLAPTARRSACRVSARSFAKVSASRSASSREST